MIAYQKDPLSLGDASKLKAWLSMGEAQLFRECVTAQLNEYYFEAINAQSKPAESIEDECRFNNQAKAKLDRAHEVLSFIRTFEKFCDSNYGFHKLKINT